MYSKGTEKHRDHVEQVFQCLNNHWFIVNGGKCEFGVSKIAYLGHIISNEGYKWMKKK